MESKGRLVLLVIAGIVVAFAAIALRSRLSQEEVPAVVEKTVSNRVLVARHDIAPGTQLQSAQDLDWAAPADGMVKESDIRETNSKIEDFNGAVARRPLHSGDPIAQGALSKAGEGGFMSAVLEPGMRAVSVSVTPTSGNAGFISPGDRVDIIVTHHIKAKDSNSSDSVVSETFVHNVRVLAIDQQLDNPENKAILAKTVTVEVSPHQAEQVSVASEMGKISMSLVSLSAPAPQVKTAATPNDAAHAINDLYGDYTRDSDVSEALGHGGTPRIRVIRGDQVENIEIY